MGLNDGPIDFPDFAGWVNAELRDALLRREHCIGCGEPLFEHDDSACEAKLRAWRPQGALCEARRLAWIDKGRGWHSPIAISLAPVESMTMTEPLEPPRVEPSRVDVHLHIHVHPEPGPVPVTAEQVRTIVTDVVGRAATEIEETDMSRNDDLMAEIAQLQAGQTQTLVDLQRLLTDTGAPQTALDAVKALIDQNTSIDGMINAADPAPATDGTASAEVTES